MNKATTRLLLLTALAAMLAGCGKKEADRPPEKAVIVTTTTVSQRDLEITESAVGNTTSLGVAQALDPTQARRGTFAIRLPFPEHIARQLRIGQTVRLSSFSNPDKIAIARIQHIRPALDSSTQTMEVIAALPGGHEWYSLGSVRGEVVLGVRRGALAVPEQAVVLRPAGSVVYSLDQDTARERAVQTGVSRDGLIEIVAGLKAGETVVVDGAALLTGGTKVRRQGAAADTELTGKVQP